MNTVMVNPNEHGGIEQLKDIVSNKIKDIGISKHTLHTFLQIIIETVEGADVKGELKKELAVLIMTELVESMSQSSEKEFVLELIHNGTVSNMIDLVVMASRGEININKVVAVSNNCCIGFLRR
jgi:hypothetical protein